ncbi:hypothetical protein ACJZ2D_014370 [Fusarium nematophilum]
MDPFTQAFFSIFMIVSGLLLIAAWLSLLLRTSGRFGTIRFWTVIPLAIYGPLVVLYPWWGYDRSGRINPGYAFLGIWLAIWPLISAYIARRCKRRGSMDTWETCQRSRGPFFIVCVDMALFLFSIVDACRHPIPLRDPVWVLGRDLGKIMRMIVILLLASQIAIILPTTPLPRIVEVPTVVIARLFRHSQSRAKNTWPCDLEELLSRVSERRNALLAALFRDDQIVDRIATNLHYSDLVSLSLASKLMRTALFYPGPDSASNNLRIESLCEASCLKGKKTECWGCERVTCEECETFKTGIQSSRVNDHFINCYAVCTLCYIRSNPGRGAPFRAKWHLEDLEGQHSDRCDFKEPHFETDGVTLCRGCAALDGGAVAAMREARDTLALRRTLPRNIDLGGIMSVTGEGIK